MSAIASRSTTLLRSGRWLTPINLAAYLTWASISFAALQLHRPQRSPLLSGESRAAWAAALLLLFLALFVIALRWREAVPRLRALSPVLLTVLLQGACVIAAHALLRRDIVVVLLILVAAQLGGFLRPRHTALWLLAINLSLLLPQWVSAQPLEPLLNLLPIFAFQAFAALAIHYAVSAERTRDELLRSHAELLATRSLLDESARAAERLRLSRELHDVAGHSLTALKLNLSLALREPALNSREELRVAEQLASDLLAQIRQVVGALRAHDGLDLNAALNALRTPFPDTYIAVSVSPELRVEHLDQAETLLRCAQESITNAVRHGAATRIDISLCKLEGGFELKVRNNGRLTPAVVYGNGLIGMRERLAVLGGSLTLTQSPAEGFAVRVFVPRFAA